MALQGYPLALSHPPGSTTWQRESMMLVWATLHYFISMHSGSMLVLFHAGSVPCWLHTLVLQRGPSPYFWVSFLYRVKVYLIPGPYLMQGNMRNYCFGSLPPPFPPPPTVVSGAYDVWGFPGVYGAPGVCGTPGVYGVCVSPVPVVPQMPIWLLVQPHESI